MLRRHRLSAGLRQQDLSATAGLSERTLRNLESGRVRNPRRSSIEKLSCALELGPSDRAQLLAQAGPPVRSTPAPLTIHVLGELLVRRGPVRVVVRSSLQRRLLGLLAIQPGTIVPVSQIVDALWGEDLPRTCTELVHGHVAQVRRLLEPDRERRARATVLRSVHSGYLLELPREQVDISRFDDLIEAGNDARTAGRDGDAEARLDEALSLWRGPLLVDAGMLLGDSAVIAAVRQRRVDAALAYADLAVGRRNANRAVARLRPLLADEPLHEGLCVKVMEAMSAVGERASALDAFAGLRSRLADQLGIEPGAEAQRLHVELLRGEPPVTVPAPARVSLPELRTELRAATSEIPVVADGAPRPPAAPVPRDPGRSIDQEGIRDPRGGSSDRGREQAPRPADSRTFRRLVLISVLISALSLMVLISGAIVSVGVTVFELILGQLE
jgi:DNA-binding SARP family transcriptional activator/DNA-binding Xre family transcriptional regulator